MREAELIFIAGMILSWLVGFIWTGGFVFLMFGAILWCFWFDEVKRRINNELWITIMLKEKE